MKQKHPHIKTLISVGGWTWSKYFSDVALTADSRAKFVTSCVNFMKQYSFDGIDIDWYIFFSKKINFFFLKVRKEKKKKKKKNNLMKTIFFFFSLKGNTQLKEDFQIISIAQKMELIMHY